MSKEIKGKNAADLCDLGFKLGKEGKFQEAIEYFEKAIELEPGHDKAYYYMGAAYEKLENYEKAIECYEKAVNINPKSVKSLSRIGLCYEKLDEIQKAIEAYERVIKVDPKLNNAWYNIGINYKKLNKSDKAMEYFEKSVELNPHDVEAWGHIVAFYLDKNDYEKAIEVCERAGNEGYFALGTIYGKKGDFKKELECYEKFLVIYPNDKRVWNNMGTAYKDLGHKNKAERAWKIADQIESGARIRDEDEVKELIEIVKYGGLDPVYKGKAANKAIERGQQSRDPKEKINHYHEALGLYASVANELGAANAMRRLAGVYRQQEEWELAIEMEKQAYEIHKKVNYDMFMGEEIHNIGFCYFGMGKYEKAIPYFEESIEIHKKLDDKRRLGDSRFNLANCYKKLGNYEKAIEVFEECLKNDIEAKWEDNQAYDLKELGVVYKNKGDNEKANEYLDKSLKLFEKLGYESEITKVKDLIKNIKKLD
jgi:tetratricopeptide (TPR) repeat protein